MKNIRRMIKKDFSENLLAFIWPFVISNKFSIFFLFICKLSIQLMFVWLHPSLISKIINSINDNYDVETIGMSLMHYVLMWVLLLILGILEDIFNLYTLEKISANSKRVLLNYALKHPIEYFNEKITQIIISKINNISQNCSIIVKNLFIGSLIFICTQVVVFFTLFKTHSLLFYCTFGSTLFYILIMSLLNKYTKNPILELQNLNSSVFKKMNDEMNNIEEIKNFGNENIEKLILSQSIKAVFSKKKSITFLKVKIKTVKELASLLLVILNISIMFFLKTTSADISISKMILIIQMSSAIMLFNRTFIQDLLEGIEIFNINQADYEYIIEPIKIQNKENAIDLGKNNQILDGSIEFKSVFYSYKTTQTIKDENGDEKEEIVTEQEIFKDLSVNIKAKEKIGITGYSGSGKSTFIKLLMRFIDIDSGYIIFNNKYDVRDITQESLRKNITYIQQNADLFSRSIMDNILYGKPDATEAEVFDVANKTGCLEFINTLPDKFNTIIGENSSIKLSFGQEKLILLARAMLKNSPILILDDFFNGIDNITESKINEALKVLGENKTVIVITHDLPLLKFMDRILVFDNGTIVESGTHNELIKKENIDENGIKSNGLYKQMWNSQIENIGNNNSSIKQIEQTIKNVFENISKIGKKK